MANWKKIITEADNADYQNEKITFTQLDAGLDSASGYAAGKTIRVNSGADGLEWGSAGDVSSIVAGAGIDVSGATGDVTVSAESASASNPGVVELATTAETTTGTDTARAVTPDGLKDGYEGSANVTTLGTIATGTWQGDAIADSYLSTNTAHLSGTQTFSGNKTFSGSLTAEGTTSVAGAGAKTLTIDAQGLAGGASYSSMLQLENNDGNFGIYTKAGSTADRGNLAIISNHTSNYTLFELKKDSQGGSLYLTPCNPSASSSGQAGLSVIATGLNQASAGGSDSYSVITADYTVTGDGVTGWDTVNLIDLKATGTSKFKVDNSGNVTIGGDLTISGTTITTATETLEIADNTLILNSDLTGTAVDCGFVFERGSTGDNKTLYFDTSADTMVMAENASAAIGGTYQADLMMVRKDGAVPGSSSDVPIGHMQYYNGSIYVRVED